MESKILNALGIDPAFIFLFMLILFVVLFILYVNVTMKYNRLKNSYATFMKGKDGKSLEQSLKDKFEEAEAVLKFTKQNRTEIRELNRKLETNYQKVGIVKYDAFNEMGGKLSFALAMLDGNDSGWIINAMHSREGCYTYVKEIAALPAAQALRRQPDAHPVWAAIYAFFVARCSFSFSISSSQSTP